HFALDTGFVADGSLILSDEGFCRIQGRSPDDVTLGLLKVTSGSDPAVVARALSEQLPEDVVVLTREEVNRFEVNRWVKNTSIGIIFQLGVAVALMVGTAIVYQVLYSDVANRLAEYATLKAMGYDGGYLAKVVLQQAAALALLGFVPGLLIAEILYRITGAAARLPMQTTWPQIAFVLILSVVMCMVSGLGALRKVRAADPADLF
ncbi:MAG: FtsX-like permease family protein, partial [Planctomycetes bacterium]|nr:FtsX-like permease family protein [Planctomycetota bacterium]